MLRTQNLQIRRGRKIVLTDITLELKPGEVLGVLGPNGAGKSTLLGALCGELQAHHGSVWLDERELSDWAGDDASAALGGIAAGVDPGLRLSCRRSGRHGPLAASKRSGPR